LARTIFMGQTPSDPQLLTVAQAASLLNVSETTIRRWAADDEVPCAKLRSGGLRIPRGALLTSLQDTHDLGAELVALDKRNASVSADRVRLLLDEDEHQRSYLGQSGRTPSA
jgi:excisionase family DNA binding protein